MFCEIGASRNSQGYPKSFNRDAELGFLRVRVLGIYAWPQETPENQQSILKLKGSGSCVVGYMRPPLGSLSRNLFLHDPGGVTSLVFENCAGQGQDLRSEALKPYC